MRRALAPLGLLFFLSRTARAVDVVWPSVIDRTATALEAPDVDVRRHAASALALLPPAAVRRVAVSGLDDPDADVRIAAAAALVAARLGHLGERVASWLTDSDARVRRAAAEALTASPFAGAIGSLGRALADPDSTVRVASARALGASGAPSAVGPLLGRLDDPEADVREAVVAALARLGDRTAVVPLIGKIEDNRPEVRRSVAEALGMLGDPRASSALVLSLRDSDEAVRVASLDALGRLRAVDTVVTILPLLGDEKRPVVRSAVLRALSQIPSEVALQALVHALASDDPDEASELRDAIRSTGQRAVPFLAACLAGQAPTNQAEGCALVLGEIAGDAAVSPIETALHDGQLRATLALRALSSTGSSRALGTVLEFLGSTDAWVRQAAVKAADAILDPAFPDGRAVEPIIRAIHAEHGQRQEHTALVMLLGKTGSPRAAPLLIELSREASEPSVCLAAIRSLGLVGRSGQDKVLLERIDDEEPTIRLAAAISLRRVGSAASAPILLDRIDRAADQDRRALALALRGPMSVTTDAGAAARIEAIAERSTGAIRDLLIEALGAMPNEPGSSVLVRLLAGSDGPTRAKIAEALSAHPESERQLVELAHDPDGAVRANAVWALGAVGAVGDRGALDVLERAVADDDPAVSGNAAAALGRMGARDLPASAALCRALSDSRSYTRGNALVGLTAMRIRCGAAERELLASDPSEWVRGAAARLLEVAPSREAILDRAALARCASEDPSSEVARRCGSVPGVATDGATDDASRGTVPIRVYVVPSGSDEPSSGAPFALLRPDGFARLGVSDRTGGVFEYDMPWGVVRLGIPAPL